MHITGTVVDHHGQPLSGATVQALGANRATLSHEVTDPYGRFQLASDGTIALMILPPGWGTRATAVEFLPHLYRIPGVPRPREAHVEIEMKPGVRVPITAYDDTGKRIGALSDKHRLLINPNHISLLDLGDMPATGGFHWSEQDEGPTLLFPPDEPRVLQMLWTAPGYGRVICRADRRGQGFVADGRPIVLNVEFAETAWRRLHTEVQRCSDGGYELSEEFASQMARAKTSFDEMIAAADPRDKAALADAALGAILLAGETLVRERAATRLERHRKKPFSVALKDASGEPIKDAKVRYRQVAHDFRFGVFINPHTHPIQRVPLDSSPLWARVKEMGMNQLPLALIWPRVEPEQGRRTEHVEYDPWPADQLAAAGFSLKSHVAIWFWQGEYPDQWGVFVPDWAYDLSLDEIKEAVYRHTKALIEKYAPHVTTWQAINEAMLYHTNALNLNLHEHMEVVGEVVRAIRESAPGAPIEVNNCQVFGEGIQPMLREQGYERVPDEFYQSLLEHGVDFDAVGMQLYYGGYMDSPMWRGGFPIRHPWDIEAVIERYSRLGKKIHVTEVSVPSSHPPPDRGIDFGYWHGPWTPERQAEWVELFYTLCYSMPQVHEITWWNATDEAAFINDGGLLYSDYTPKPAALTLARLTSGWLSSGEAQSDQDGLVTLQGPAGVYELQVELGGNIAGSVRLHLDPNAPRRAEATLGPSPDHADRGGVA